MFSFFKKKKGSSSNKQLSDNTYSEISESISVSTAINSTQEINKVYSIDLNGLFIGEIILIDYLDNRLKTSAPADYFAYRYGINHNNSINKLKQMGLIRIGSPSECLVGLKVPALKKILSENKLKISGRKAELIQRISETLDESLYTEHVSPVWKKTSRGSTITEQYSLLIWGHNNGDLSGTVSPATLLPYLNDNRPYEKIALSLSQKEFRNKLRKLHYGMAKSELRYQIELKEKLNLQDEVLDLLIGQAILEFTGIQNASSEDTIYFWERHNYSHPIKTSLINSQSRLSIDTDDILERANIIFDAYEPHLSKTRLYKDKNEFLIALKTLLDGTENDLEILFAKWYNRAPSFNKFDSYL